MQTQDNGWSEFIFVAVNSIWLENEKFVADIISSDARRLQIFCLYKSVFVDNVLPLAE